MAKSQTAEVLLQWRVDTASVNRVRSQFANVEYELSDLRAELTGVGTSAQQGVSALRSRFAQGETAINSMQDEVEELRRDLLALDDVTVTPTVAVQGAGGTGASGLESVDRFGRFGTQFAGAFGASGSVGNVVGFVGDLADSVATLGPAGGAAAVGIGAVSLALAKFTSDAEAAGERIRNAIAGESAAEQLVATGTLAEQEARRAEILRDLKLAQEQLTERQIELLNYTNQLAPAQAGVAAGLAEMNIILGEDAAVIDAYTNEIDKQQGIIDNLTAEFIELNARIGEAPQKLVEMTDKLSIMLSGVDKISKGIKGASDGIQGGIASGSPFADTFAAQQSALMTTRTDAYLAAMTRTVEAQEALTKAQQAYDEAVRASGARIAEINAKLQADLAEAEADRQRDLADVAREAGDERVKITEQTEKERARIEKRFERSYAQAVGDRDALAAKRAQEQRDDELDQLDERYKDQLKAVDKSLAQQQKVIEDRYRNQVATINAAAQAAVRTEQQAAQARLQALQQGVQAAQVALVNAQQSEYLIRANFYNQSISQAQSWASLMQLYMAYGFSIPNTGGGSIKMPTPIPGKASGGPVIAGKPYVVGERGSELFVPATNGRIIPNGAAFTINVTGAQTDTIKVLSRQQALTAFDGILRQMGVA